MKESKFRDTGSDELTDPSVLFVGLSAFGEHGGIQRFNRRVAGALVDNGWRPRVLMLNDNPAALTAGLPGQQVRSATGSRVRLFAALPAMARDTGVLLLGHINLLPVAIAYRLLRPRSRVILFAHGIEAWDDPRYRRRRRHEPALLRMTVNQVAAVSRYTRDRMASAFQVPRERFAIFPNAVPLIPNRLRRRCSQKLLTVTRLGAGEREKHVDKLIRAMPEVIAACPEATLEVIGDGPLRSEYKALAEELGVSSHVRLRGSVDDAALSEAYRDAAAFVLPSSKEGFGIVYLEAWLHGLPVIGSRFGAGGEVITNGADGFTVDPEDVSLLADRMTVLLADPESAERIAAAGRAKVEQLYTEEAMAWRLRRLCMGEALMEVA